MPTVRHATLKEAQAEAERLAKKHQGFQFEILEFKGLSSLHDSITFWVDGVDPDDNEYVSDGHGNEWMRCGPDCDMEVVRVGKVQCSCRELEQQVEPELTNEPEPKPIWEVVYDQWNTWLLQRIRERGLERGFHLARESDAKNIRDILNKLENKTNDH
jgi:hypothetical protein